MATKIIDSTGKEVGKFISLFGSDSAHIAALVQMTISHKIYIMPVYPDRIGNENNFLLYHESNDCSGASYIIYDPNADLYSRYELTPIGWLSNFPEGVSPQTIIANSNGETSSESCQSLSSSPVTVVTLAEATGPDFRAGFTPPFSIQ